MEKNSKSFDEVLTVAGHYLTQKESIDLITAAYEYAKKAHDGQFRKTGDPYVSHVVNVAYILASLQAGPQTIAAGLLHDTIEDCGKEYSEIAELFGIEVADMVEAVTKVGRLKTATNEEFEAENHRKIFIAMAKDIRVIIIKLADRLHNMRTLYAHEYYGQQKRIAQETLKVFAPIAHRLGINTVKSELEDLALKYLEPEKYGLIKNLLAKKEIERKATLDAMNVRIENLLKQYNIPHSISGRVKSIYSIYKKMFVNHRMFEEIYDLHALRIITDTVPHCYEILGYIHATYRPIPGRFKDYVAMPKPNLYQSLHTTIVAEDGAIFEIQIRTKDMDEIAETGVAAHWRYKENTNYSSKAEQKEIEEKLHWFRELVSISDEQAEINAREYMESLQQDIFEANVYVLTPKGRVIDLPKGSTPVDFAYRVHTQVGHNTIGATVNGVLVPLSTHLKTGDVVDIKTSKLPQLPNEDWLKFVKTNGAKNSIKKAIMKSNLDQRKDEFIAQGREMVENALKNDKNIDYQNAVKKLDDKKFLSLMNVETLDALYTAIATKNSTLGTLLGHLRNVEKKENIQEFAKKKIIENISGVIVPGIDTVAITFSQCCSPIPGDEIVGYISKGKGIKVHRIDCHNVRQESRRLIDIKWDYEWIKENTSLYYVDIQVRAADRPQLMSDVVNHLSMLKVSVNSVNRVRDPSSMGVALNLCIQVRNALHLQEIMNSLGNNVTGVTSIERITKS